jgi:hypothetical protein
MRILLHRNYNSLKSSFIQIYNEKETNKNLLETEFSLKGTRVVLQLTGVAIKVYALYGALSYGLDTSH